MKRERAMTIMADVDFGLSGQVLAEFYAVVTGTRHSMPAEEAQGWLEVLSEQPLIPIDHELVAAGAQISQRYQISYWDGAILAAAERIGASVLYTEDLSHGQAYGSVRVVNPFREAS